MPTFFERMRGHLAAEAAKKFEHDAAIGAMENRPYRFAVNVQKFSSSEFERVFNEMGRRNGGAVISKYSQNVKIENGEYFFVETSGQASAVQALFLAKNAHHLFVKDIILEAETLNERYRRQNNPKLWERILDSIA